MSKALKILSRPRGNAEEYGKWSVNPYIGCSHGCLYCYLKKGPSGGYLGQPKPVLKKGVVSKEHAFHLAMTEIYANYEEIIRDGGLFMTFTSDPCVEETRHLFFNIALESARDLRIPVMLLTKSADFVNFWLYADITSGLLCMGRKVKSRLAFGWTLTGHDELEPNASPNDKRINAMRLVSANGFKTWASIEPVIDFDASYRMIQQALDAGCQHFKIGLLTNNTRVVRKDCQIGEYQFKAYDVIDCMHFIEDVMRLTEGKATVYWKQSVRDLLETIYTPAAVDELLNYPHSVGKDWNMFKKED